MSWRSGSCNDNTYFLVVAVVGSSLVDQLVLDKGTDFVSSVGELKSSGEGFGFELDIVSKTAVSRPARMGPVQSLVDLFHFFVGGPLVHFVLNAEASEVPLAPRVFVENDQGFLRKVNDENSV